MDSANQAAECIQKPVLVLAAGEDDYINVEQICRWFDRISSTDKTLKIFLNSYHRLFFDKERKEVEKAILCWLKQRS